MKIYNTLSKQKEEFQPIVKEKSACMSADRRFITISISEMQDQ